MKIRSGFVSNSSSSSFVILGFEVSENEIDKYPDLHQEYIESEGIYIVGKKLCDIGEWEVDSFETKELFKALYKLSKYNKLSKIYCGNVYG